MTNSEKIKMAFSGVIAPEGIADRVLRNSESDTGTKPINLYYRKRRFAVVAIIVLLAVIVTSTALAYAHIIDFSRIYRIVFGEKSEYVEQFIEPFVSENTTVPEVNETQTASEQHSIDEQQPIDELQPTQTVIECEYDGIVIRLISALNDGDALRIFATMTDTTGDRLSNSIDFTKWGLSQGGGGNISVVDYDRETKTATILITSLGEHPNGSATLRINDFTTDRESKDGLTESNISVYDNSQHHTPQTMSWEEVWLTGGVGGVVDHDQSGKPLYRDTKILKSDEMNVKFSNIGWAHISNLGFVDGIFHIQTANLINDDNYLINMIIVDEKSDVVYSPSQRIDCIDYENRYGYNGGEPFYQYQDWIFKSITDIEQLRGLCIVYDILEGGNAVEGNWEFSFDIPQKITTEVNYDVNITINGESIKIDTVSLSPLGVFLKTSENITSFYQNEDIAAFAVYDDGTLIELNEFSIHGYQDTSILKFSGNVIEVERVICVRISSAWVQ